MKESILAAFLCYLNTQRKLQKTQDHKDTKHRTSVGAYWWCWQLSTELVL